jgi:hypothetical protein
MDYMVYAELRLARDDDARRVMTDGAAVTAFTALRFAGPYAQSAMPARYAIERGDWKEAMTLEPRPSQFPFTVALTHFARGLGAARSGNTAAADKEIIAFATGCSYRRRLESWLGAARVEPERVMEFGPYHAIVACVAAGSGIAIVPRSVIRVSSAAASGVATYPLPSAVAKARTFFVWRQGHHSIALEAMRTEVRRITR